MKLRDLNPELIEGVVIWFDCPNRCSRGRHGVILSPAYGRSGGPQHGWSWTGVPEGPEWNVTLNPSLKYDETGCHFGLVGGILQQA